MADNEKLGIVFDQLAAKLTAAANAAQQSIAENENLEHLAAYLKKMIPIINELQHCVSGNEVVPILQTCCKNVDSAHQLITLCNNKSRMYLLTQSRSVVDKLESVCRELGRNLGFISVSNIADHQEMKVAMDWLSREMQTVQFQVTDCEDHICSVLERKSSNIRSDLAAQTSILKDIATTVGVKDLNRDPSALKNQIELAKSDIEGSEDFRKVNLIESIFDSWIERQAQLSPPREASPRGPIHLEEPFDSFLCPLLKSVMTDPVNIETGRTYERSAIEQWFRECLNDGRPVTCPATHMELECTKLTPNIALRHTIEQWTARNEALRLKHAVSLQHGSSEADILIGLQDIQALCYQNAFNKSEIRREVPSIAKLLENKIHSEKGRCIAYETLQTLAEDDDEMKELMGKTTAIYTAVKSLSRDQSQETMAALSFLQELSTSLSLCEKIGSTNGAILILIGLSGNNLESLAHKAEQTLQNLERQDQNIKEMAENGRLNPLIRRLHEGPEEVHVKMATHISEIPLNHEGKTMLAEEGTDILVKMLSSKKLIVREAALKALSVLSSQDSNAKLLVKAGVLQALMNDLFMAGHAPPKQKEIAATIVANVVSFGNEWESVQINENGHTLTSEPILNNLLHLISNSGPAMAAKLLQVLLGFASSATEVVNLVNNIISAGAIVSLIQFIEAPQKDIVMSSVRLLNCLSPHMGQQLADGLRITHQLDKLVKLLNSKEESIELAADSAGLLANLPVMDFQLTRALYDAGIVPIVINKLQGIGQNAPRRGAKKYVAAFQEGLIGILGRFTFNLDDPDILKVAKEYDLASQFTIFLNTLPLDKVQEWSAVALLNLSLKSLPLAELIQPPIQTTTFFECLCPCFVKSKPTPDLCPIHASICTSKETFCLIEANAIDPLVSCLESSNIKAVEAALDALLTLIQEPYVEKGVKILQEAAVAINLVAILREHKTEHLRERAAWTLEIFLRSGGIPAAEVAMHPNLHASLVDAFKNGGYQSRQHAQKCLKHLQKIDTTVAVPRRRR